MNIEDLKEEINLSMSDALTQGEGRADTASAYYLEAIAKMMYYRMFHEHFVYDDPSVVEIPQRVNPEEDETS